MIAPQPVSYMSIFKIDVVVGRGVKVTTVENWLPRPSWILGDARHVWKAELGLSPGAQVEVFIWGEHKKTSEKTMGSYLGSLHTVAEVIERSEYLIHTVEIRMLPGEQVVVNRGLPRHERSVSV